MEPAARTQLAVTLRHMPTRRVLIVVAVLAACTPNRQGSTGSAAGSTSSAGGADTVHADTTHPVDTTHSSSGAGIMLTLDREHYAAGATVTMRITNNTSEQLGYNPCTNSALERQESGRWTPQQEPPDRVCPMYMRLLGAHETQSATTELPSPLGAGTYRIVESFSSQRPQVVRAESPPFRVP
jgi:hypothetical protein